MEKPLADEIRPKTLDEVVGQRHLLAQGSVLRRIIEVKRYIFPCFQNMKKGTVCRADAKGYALMAFCYV